MSHVQDTILCCARNLMLSLTPQEAMLEVKPRKMVQLFFSSAFSSGSGSFRLAICRKKNAFQKTFCDNLI